MRRASFLRMIYCTFLALALVGCSAGGPTSVKEYTDVGAAGRALGFSCKEPGWLPEGYEVDGVYVVSGVMLQVSYSNNIGRRITYRAAGPGNDVSGNYADYDIRANFDVNGVPVVGFSNVQDHVTLAHWSDGNANYALLFSQAQELSNVIKLIEGMQ